jgi:hypothetical protein
MTRFNSVIFRLARLFIWYTAEGRHYTVQYIQLLACGVGPYRHLMSRLAITKLLPGRQAFTVDSADIHIITVWWSNLEIPILIC